MPANIIDRVVGFFSAKAALSREVDRLQLGNLRNLEKSKMSYDATGTGRRSLKAASDGSVKALVSSNLIKARKNARDLQRNNAIYDAAIQAKVHHTVGDGIRPSITSKRKNNPRRLQVVQDRISTWANSVNCDVYGQNNLFAQQHLGWETRAVSGEVLFIRQRTEEPSSGIHLQLKMLEGDYLDHGKTCTEKSGNQVINGVEFDSNDRPVAYWLFDQHPNDVGLFKKISLRSQRHDAANVIHLFDCKRPGQIRGLPDGLSAFTRIKNLDEFQDARLDLMKIAACFVGSVTQDVSGPGASKNATQGDPLPARVEPGLLLRLNANEKMEFNQPPNVSGQDSFVSEELRMIAAVFGISYEALTGDYSKVNFTSGRMGWLSMHTKNQSDRTRMIVPLFLNRIWQWLQEALELEGVIVSEYACQWIPPRREMFDPGKEIPPLIKAIRAGLKPMQRALIEQGDNPQTILSQYQEWNKWLDDQTMIFDTDPRRVSGAGNTNPTPENKDEEEP